MTKKQAIAEANKLRQDGQVVKVVLVKGVHTVPGKGTVGFVRYEIRHA